MKTHKLIIIGSGPAGLATACFTHLKGTDVLILEKNNSAAKKLLISGTGQCNLTNGIEIKHFIDKYGPNKKFIRPALFNFTNKDLIDFFEKRGCALIKLPNQKIFPKSLKSKDVLNVLLNECNLKGIAIRYNEKVLKITKKDERYLIQTPNQTYSTENLTIATGGLSYPKTGSNGDGFNFAESLGHSINQTAPALTPILIKDYLFKECAGISIKHASIEHFRNSKKMNATSGDLLFTHEGLSGPGIIDYSRYLQKGDILKLNLVGFKSIELFDQKLISLLNGARRKIKNAFTEYSIPERLLLQIFRICKIDPDKQTSNISKFERKAILKNLFSLEFEVNELGSYKSAMATKGGVNLKEVNPKTMQSRICEGLFFSGEILDIDGDTGGFNIQFAFSSAALISSYLKEISIK